jgi:hypothetical protein
LQFATEEVAKSAKITAVADKFKKAALTIEAVGKAAHVAREETIAEIEAIQDSTGPEDDIA